MHYATVCFVTFFLYISVCEGKCIYGNSIFQTRSQSNNAKFENDDASMLEDDLWPETSGYIPLWLLLY